jgi:tRNA pseudouridine55 synthase
MSLQGLLVIDKPVGPTSHDVVARVRRILGESQIGHTGTLDPMASGVLPLVVGRATRLARFLNADDKRYDATIRLGFSTDTCDALGEPVGPRHMEAMPSREAIEGALDNFRGTFLQQPPAFSAKKIGGRRSYRIARAHARATAKAQADQLAGPVLLGLPAPLPATPALPDPVVVSATHIEIVEADADLVSLRIACSGGFYVRSLAHDLGRALGVGAHLTALRRTEASGRTLAEAISLASIEQDAEGVDRARAALIPLASMLPALRTIALTADGVRRAASGSNIGPRDVDGPFVPPVRADGQIDRVQLLDPAGNLVGIAEPASMPGLLHPVVVLV